MLILKIVLWTTIGIIISFILERKVKSFNRIIDNTDVGLFLFRIWFSITIFIITFIPTWFYLFVKNSLNPQGFWAELVVLGMGIYFLGGIQLLLFTAFIWCLLIIWEKQ